MFNKNFNIWEKVRFLSKITIFEHNSDFWAQFWFLSKITIFEQNYDFWAQFWFLSTILIFEQNYDFWAKFRSLIKNYNHPTFVSTFVSSYLCKNRNLSQQSEFYQKTASWTSISEYSKISYFAQISNFEQIFFSFLVFVKNDEKVVNPFMLKNVPDPDRRQKIIKNFTKKKLKKFRNKHSIYQNIFDKISMFWLEWGKWRKTMLRIFTNLLFLFFLELFCKIFCVNCQIHHFTFFVIWEKLKTAELRNRDFS